LFLLKDSVATHGLVLRSLVHIERRLPRQIISVKSKC
jgi:hypothetical protein